MPLNRCCCFDLKTGVIIIGVLDLVSSCNSIFSILKGFLNLDFMFAPYGPLQPYAEKAKCDAECMLDIRHIVVIIFAVMLFLNILNLTAASLLIHGARKNHPGLMTFYLVKLGFVLGLLVVCVPLSLFLAWKEPVLALCFTLPLALAAMLLGYIFMVVRDYKIQLLQKEGSMPTRLLEEESCYPVKG